MFIASKREAYELIHRTLFTQVRLKNIELQSFVSKKLCCISEVRTPSVVLYPE